MHKLVSIIIPCFNQAQYLPDALNSVLNQSYQKWECIIVNDGSPDNTEEIALEWCKKDPRFKYIKQENKGLSSARNSGISKSCGVYILPLDADDKIENSYLEQIIYAFNRIPKLKLVYCRAEYFGERSGEWFLCDYSLKKLAIENHIFCSAAFRRSDWESLNGYDENLIYGLEDWDFWIRLLQGGGVVKKIDKILFYYRIRSGSMIRSMDNEQTRFTQKRLNDKHYGFFFEQLGLPGVIASERDYYKDQYHKKRNSFIYIVLKKIKNLFFLEYVVTDSNSRKK